MSPILSQGDEAMFIACWSAKGGQGTTTVATSLALQLTERAGPKTILVDLVGDADVVVGHGVPPKDPGDLSHWLDVAARGPSGPLPAHTVSDRLSVVHRGPGDLEAASVTRLVELLKASGRHVVVDCGKLPDSVGSEVARRADQSLLVTRACYLALRRAGNRVLPKPSGVVLVTEPGRVLSRDDVRGAVLAPVVAEVPVDPSVARLVDAGMLRGRMPPSLRRLAGVLGPEPSAPAPADLRRVAAERVLDQVAAPTGPSIDNPAVGQ